MPNLLSLPVELQRMIFAEVPNVHRLATLCKAVLPVICECIYSDITVTYRNIPALVRTSRKLGYTNIRTAHSLRFPASWMMDIDTEIEDLYSELLEHARPVVFEFFEELAMDNLHKVDTSRLCDFAALSHTLSDILQRTSASLRRLELVTYATKPFTSSNDFPPMPVLIYLSLDLKEVPVAQSEDLARFLRACVALSTLKLETEAVTMANRVLHLCGKTLTELQLRYTEPALLETIDQTIDLASYAPNLQCLDLYYVETRSFASYPPTVSRLLLESSPPHCKAILRVVQSSTALPSLSSMTVNFFSDHEDAVDIHYAFWVACDRRQIHFAGDVF